MYTKPFEQETGVPPR